MACMQTGGKQFSTYLTGRVADALMAHSEKIGVSPYALLARTIEDYLEEEGALKPKQTLDMSHHEKAPEELKVSEPVKVVRRRRRGY